jgi:hypothetical protein
MPYPIVSECTIRDREYYAIQVREEFLFLQRRDVQNGEKAILAREQIIIAFCEKELKRDQQNKGAV